jgi:hypothetical protein
VPLKPNDNNEEDLSVPISTLESDSSSDDNLSISWNAHRHSACSTSIVSLKDIKLEMPARRRHTLSDEEDTEQAILLKEKNKISLKQEDTLKTTVKDSRSSFLISSDEYDSDDLSSSPISSVLSELVSDMGYSSAKSTDTKLPGPSSSRKTMRPIPFAMDMMNTTPSWSLSRQPSSKVTRLTPGLPPRSVNGIHTLLLNTNEIVYKNKERLVKEFSSMKNADFSPLSRPLSKIELDMLSQGTDKIKELLDDESWWQDDQNFHGMSLPLNSTALSDSSPKGHPIHIPFDPDSNHHLMETDETKITGSTVPSCPNSSDDNEDEMISNYNSDDD